MAGLRELQAWEKRLPLRDPIRSLEGSQELGMGRADFETISYNSTPISAPGRDQGRSALQRQG